MRYWLVMPAAGVGRRFGTTQPKQYAPLQGRTVIEWALAPFFADPTCAGVVVGLAAEDPYWPEVSARLPQVIQATGGVERSDTVRNGLEALRDRATEDDWVLVHDAARPCLSSHDLQHLLERLSTHRVGGLLATPAADTLKRAQPAAASARDATPARVAISPAAPNHAAPSPPSRDALEVAQTVDRSSLWRALTPQMFRYKLLCDALDLAVAGGRLPTDEAQALEWMGEHPMLVQGSAVNIKITSADDLVLATALLNARLGSKST